jgi:hypothetical protein
MRQKILSCIIAVNFILSSILGTSAAIFADSGTSSMSLTAGRVEIQLGEIAVDGLSTEMNAIILNKGDINANLWLENIYPQQNEAAVSGLAGPSGIATSGNADDVTVEVFYKSGKSSFFIDDLDQYDAPLLLLEDMEPGSEALVTIIQNTTEPTAVTAAPGPAVEAVLSMQELSEPAVESEETPAAQAAADPVVDDRVDLSSIPAEVQPENTAEPDAASSAPEPAIEAEPSKPELSEPAAEYEEMPATQAAGDPVTDDPADPSGLPVEAQPMLPPEPSITSEFLAEDSLPDTHYEQLSVPVPYIFEFILKRGSFTSLTCKSVFTLIKLFEANLPSVETDKLALEIEETPATQAAGDPVDPSGLPAEAQPENTTESEAASSVPEPTVETAPGMMELFEPVAEIEETPATQAAGDPVAEDPTDPSCPPAEAQPENTAESETASSAPEPTIETAPSMLELFEFGG